MIKAIIIDDEQHCIDTLSGLLKAYCSGQVNVEGRYTSVSEGLKGVSKIHPQLVFLDVEINNETGFDFLKQVPVINFEVIFTTAYDKYAVQAFKFSAIDYLLKPVDSNELVYAIEKMQEKIAVKSTAAKLDTLLHNLNTNNTAKKLCVPVVGGFEFITIANISRCESDINYTTIFTKDKKKLTVSKTLKEFEKLLSEYNFFRIHNSHLINLDYIKSFNKSMGGFVIMEDGTEVAVSVRRKDEFLKRLAAT